MSEPGQVFQLTRCQRGPKKSTEGDIVMVSRGEYEVQRIDC